ncbi:MAG: TetR/AcrR family transcriptional regulator, partial [Solirubrobacteraceae bacterium]|nr:TetR/AcrR family transcriptional regulator [Solirubrobacteraceae bacterium]
VTDRTPGTEQASDPIPLGRKARTRQAILAAAAERFADGGVNATPVEQIAERAGVSVGALYAHFGSKQGLVLAFISEALDTLEVAMAEARRVASPIQRVHAAGEAYFRFAVDHPAAARFAAVRVLQPDASTEFEAIHRAMSRRTEKMVLGIAADLKEAMDTGEIAATPIDATVVYLWGLWNGVGALMLRTDGAAIPEELAARALHTALVTIEISSHHVREHGRPDWVAERERGFVERRGRARASGGAGPGAASGAGRTPAPAKPGSTGSDDALGDPMRVDGE